MNKITAETFAHLVIETTNAFRCGHEGKANLLLAQVFDQLLVLTPNLAENELAFIQSVIPILADAQARGDMIYLSDLLQFEVLPRFVS